MIGSLSKRSSAANWAKKALFFSGLTVLVKGILYIVEITTQYLKLIETFLGGLTLGILLTLFISGELSFKKWKKAEIENNNKEMKI